MTVRTALETIALEPLPAGWDGLVAASFSEEEIAGLLGARAPSIAGRLALKRAVAALFCELLGSAPPLTAIRVTKAANGGPVVAIGGDAGPRARELCGRMRVSISHSRRTAAAAAAAEEEAP